MSSVSSSGSPALQEEKSSASPHVTPLSMMIIIVAFVILMTVILMTLVGLMRQGKADPEERTAGKNEAFFDGIIQTDLLLGHLQQEGLSLSFGDQILNTKNEIQNGDFANAEDRLRTLLLYYPESVTAIRLFALVLYHTGRFAESEKYLLKLKSVFPEDPLLLSNIVMCQIREKKCRKAEEGMQEVLRLAPDLNTNDLNFAMIAWQKGEPAKALEHLNKAYRVLGYNLYPAFLGDPILKDILQTPEGEKILAKAKAEYEAAHPEVQHE